MPSIQKYMNSTNWTWYFFKRNKEKLDGLRSETGNIWEGADMIKKKLLSKIVKVQIKWKKEKNSY